MNFKQPDVEFDLTGRVAGKAYYSSHQIKLNLQLLIQNKENFIIDTPGHEAAHLIARQVYGWHIRSHGKEWAKVMSLIKQPAIRCHNFEVKTNYLYHCNCVGKQTYLSPCRHHRAISGKARYICKDCRGHFIWQKLQPQTI